MVICIHFAGVSYVIMIPVIVLQELDKLKHNRGDDLLKTKATRAIRYIYDELKAKNPRLRGKFVQIYYSN